MKIKFLILLPILLGGFSISLSAQQQQGQGDCIDCGYTLMKDSTVIQLSTGDEVYVLKQDPNYATDVSYSKMAQYRKTIGCPDIFAIPEPEPEPVIAASAPKIEVKPEIKQLEQEPFFLGDPVFFRINKWIIDASEWHKIEVIVDYLNKHPNATVVATGYADKKTGNATTNLKLSRERSNAVARALEIKYGIHKSRISVNWKGDGLQPYQLDNDKNRAVLFLINP